MRLRSVQEKVREFMSVKDKNLPTKPTIPPQETRHLRVCLIAEELGELAGAWGPDKDIVATADAIGDLLYLVLGTAVDCGIDIEPVFNEIHRSNMTKFIGGLKLREDGKIVKGSSYEAPKLAPILAEQQMRGPAQVTCWAGMDSDGA